MTMMWPFSRKPKYVSGEVKAAHAAQKRAEDVIQQVSDRTGEVNTYYINLRERRKTNNFGDALAAAMQKKQQN